jgi:hypothetical protein
LHERAIPARLLPDSHHTEHSMPWTPDRYPASMRRLSPVVRLKAIEIANALLAEGCDDGKAIRIGIAKAKAWAQRLGDPGALLHAGAVDHLPAGTP